MKTVIEVDRDGVTPLRVFHRAGTVTREGAKFEDSRYLWTHSLAEKKTCAACTKGTIPADVKAGTKRSV